MTYRDFVKEVAVQSRETERPLSQDDIRMVFDLSKEIIIDLLNNGDSLVIRDFVKFETKAQKGRIITLVNSEEKRELPDTVVAKVSLSDNFKKAVKKIK